MPNGPYPQGTLQATWYIAYAVTLVWIISGVSFYYPRKWPSGMWSMGFLLQRILINRKEITPCDIFGPLRNSDYFFPVQDSCVVFYKKLAPLPSGFVPKVVRFIKISRTVSHSHVHPYQNFRITTPPQIIVPTAIQLPLAHLGYVAKTW